YQTLDALTSHLLEEHREALAVHLKSAGRGSGSTQSARGTQAMLAPVPAPIQTGGRGRRRQRVHRGSGESEGEPSEPRAQDDVGEMQIAIIGLSGRYPQARDTGEFWENLASGRDSITEIPAQRWDYRDYFDSQKGKLGKIYSKWGGFIDGVEEFDPLFFNISPREAQFVDPQE